MMPTEELGERLGMGERKLPTTAEMNVAALEWAVQRECARADRAEALLRALMKTGDDTTIKAIRLGQVERDGPEWCAAIIGLILESALEGEGRAMRDWVATRAMLRDVWKAWDEETSGMPEDAAKDAAVMNAVFDRVKAFLG